MKIHFSFQREIFQPTNFISLVLSVNCCSPTKKQGRKRPKIRSNGEKRQRERDREIDRQRERVSERAIEKETEKRKKYENFEVI